MTRYTGDGTPVGFGWERDDLRFYDMLSITHILRRLGAITANDPVYAESIAREIMDRLVHRGWKPPVNADTTSLEGDSH